MNSDQSRAIVNYFADLMRREFEGTKKVIAAVPDDQRDYRPDPKSRTAWELATHIATADVWFVDSIVKGQFVTGGEQTLPPEMTNIAGVVSWYEKAFPAALDRLAKMTADDMVRITDFYGVMKLPAIGFLGLANNHGIHHRGQLASYLRAMGSKVPAIYGMSADENPFAK